MKSISKALENQLPMAHDKMLHAPLSLSLSPCTLVSTQVPSLPARNEWGESRREGNLNKTHLLSPALSSFLRQEERGKCPEIGHPLTCVDTNAPCNGERVAEGRERGLPANPPIIIDNRHEAQKP
jgi:hypothetical protein